MKIFILKTSLFPEKVAIEDAITQLESSHDITHFDTGNSDLTEEDWDKALQEIVVADHVLTL